MLWYFILLLLQLQLTVGQYAMVLHIVAAATAAHCEPDMDEWLFGAWMRKWYCSTSALLHLQLKFTLEHFIGVFCIPCIPIFRTMEKYGTLPPPRKAIWSIIYWWTILPWFETICCYKGLENIWKLVFGVLFEISLIARVDFFKSIVFFCFKWLSF